MKEPMADQKPPETMKNDLLKCMQSLLTEVTPSGIDSQQKSKTSSGGLEQIFKDKVDRFMGLSQESGHWDFISKQHLSGKFDSLNPCQCEHTWDVDSSPQVDSQDYGHTENQWRFVKISLQSLLLLDRLVTSELKSKVKVQSKQQHQPNVLGAKDLKTVAGVFQLVLTYGVWPCLSKG